MLKYAIIKIHYYRRSFMERYQITANASILGIIGNLFLLVIKGLAGFFTHSQAMIGDALNSAGDIISSMMTFIGNRIASKTADDDHNLGHGKAEYIFSMFISMIMIFIAGKLFLSSILSLFMDVGFHYSPVLIVVSLITICIKFALYLYTNKMAIKANSLLLEANAKDHRNDCFLTLLTLLSAIFSYFGLTFVDGVVGVFVSLWICFVGWILFRKSYDVLMDKGIDPALRKQIIEIIETYDEIKKINHFNSTPVGYKYQISVTIFVDGNLSTFESHEIANRLEKEISALDEVYLTIIHVNPLEIEKEED